MKKGDLVRVKEFYRVNIKWDCFGILTDVHKDDLGDIWYKIAPFSPEPPDPYGWYEDYAVEVVSEA